MKKILIIKHGSLGDIILSFPAFVLIRDNFKNSKIFLLTESRYFNIFSRSSFVNSLIEDNRKDNYVQTLSKLIKLIDEKFDLIIDLQNSSRTTFYNIFFRIFQSGKICSSRPFAHHRYNIPKQGKESVISGLLNQLKLIGVQGPIKENYYWLKTELNENFDYPLALFIPGVSKRGNYKQWQPNKFAEIAKYYENLNYTICVIGSKQDITSTLPIIKLCKNVINKIEISPPEVIYSLALKSKIIFSNDTGPGHIASLARNTLVWIANDNNVSRANKPSGEHIYQILSSSVKDITVKEVINFIKKNKLY